MSSISALSATPAFFLSLFLSTLGMSIMKSGVSKGELMLDLPMITVFIAGIYHGLDLEGTMMLLVETLAYGWMDLAGSSEAASTVFTVAFGAWVLSGIYFKFTRVFTDFKNVVMPT